MTPLDPDSQLARVSRAHRAVQRTQEAAAKAQARRVTEIRAARDLGCSFREIGDVIGVTAGRVAQLERAEATRAVKREDNRDAKARARAARAAKRRLQTQAAA